MTPERRQQVYAVFEAALLRSPAERSSFLEVASAGDASLAAEVAELLAHHEQASRDGFLAEEASPWYAVASPGAIPPLPEPVESTVRYRPSRFHAAGGLGEVFVARDEHLQREVALKRIRSDCADDPKYRHRFLREAEITGKLAHPGIVPVFGLAQSADGRPGYAMRFVEGETLHDTIRRFHESDDKPGGDSGERSLALRRLLQRFIAACNAVAYAHSRGVIHRDLKPENIMLGAYDETLVVDWGLAKELGVADAEPAGETATPVRGEHDTPIGTKTGEALGTPAYMSPEQEAGRNDEVGPASDTFSLGATLYVILTGKAPVDAVRKGVFQLSAEVRRRIPAALMAICAKALALQPENRYSTALALATDLERWLADERVSAYREPWPQRARRWARKHKPLAAGVTALLLTALFLGGCFGLWWKQQHDALVGAVQDHLDRAEQLRDAEQWDQARQALDRAEARLAGDGPAGLHDRLQRLRNHLDVVRQLNDARMQRSVVVDGKFDDAGADLAYQKIFAGLQLDPLGDNADRVAEQIARTPLRKQLAVALDDWAYVKNRLRLRGENHLLAIARLADENLWRQHLRAPSVRMDGAQLQRLAEDKEVLSQPAVNLVQLSSLLRRAQLPETAKALLRLAWQHHPNDFWISFELGNLYGEPKSLTKEEAIGYYRAALALQPHSGGVYNNLGILLKDQKRPAEAEAAYRKALQLQPDNFRTWNNLGFLLSDQNKPVEAEAAYRKALQLQPDYASAWFNLGNLLKEQKKPVEAEAAYRKAIQAQPEVATAWTSLGNLLRDQQKPVEAEAAYRKAIEAQPDHAAAWTSLGNLLRVQQKPVEAEAAHRKAIEAQPNDAAAWTSLGIFLYEDQKKPVEAEAAHRKAVEAQPDYAIAWNNLGFVLKVQNKPVEAEAAYRKAAQLQPDLAQVWTNLGYLLAGQQKQVEAEAAYRKAITIEPKAPQAYGALGQLLLNQGRLTEARDASRRARDLLPPGHPQHKIATQQLNECVQLLALEQKLPALLKGDNRPRDAAEQMAIARLCLMPAKGLYAAAARFFGEAFATEPKLADANRYDAAFAAALAGCGQGKDANQTDDAERLRLREQARTWLRADLARWSAQLKNNPKKATAEVGHIMQHWQRDADLAGVRDADALAKLPENERKQWRQLWDDVEALRQRAAAPK